MSYKIYSVESRKGGVGKTTVSLSLAKLLIRRGPVLLLDCDITGTSITEPANNSSFWNKDCNVIKTVDGKGNKYDLNLISFFQDEYIKGSGNIGNIMTKDNLKSSKINIIGSFLTGTPYDVASVNSWINDGLHSYWMVELIDDIIRTFERANFGKEVQIIIDNSPGYTSFNQSLHAYMLEKGPEIAKYILVSSLDCQDLQACIGTAEEIGNSIIDRIKVAQGYNEACKAMQKKEKLREPYNKTEKDDELYLDKNTLALINSKDELKDFLMQITDDNDMLVQYTSGKQKYSSYLGLIINKVPQSINTNDDIIDFKEMLAKDKLDILLGISGEAKTVPSFMVYYDESIVHQYYIKYLKTNTVNYSSEYWDRLLRITTNTVARLNSNFPMKNMKRLSTMLDRLQERLITHGNAQLSKQMDLRWKPDYAYNVFIKDLTRLHFSGIRTFSSNNESNDQQYVANIMKVLDTMGKSVLEAEHYHILEDFVLTTINHISSNNSLVIRQDGLIMLDFILNECLLTYTKSHKDNDLLNEYLKEEYINKTYKRRLDVNDHLIDEMNRLGIDTSYFISIQLKFTRLYPEFCYSLLRIIEQKEDFALILYALRLYVGSDKPLSFSNEMIDYITEVVVEKRRSGDYNKLSEIRSRSYTMENMKCVLSSLLNRQWK